MEGRILVVDDDDLMRRYVSGVLDDAGYEVAAANSGDAAIEMLRAEPGWPELVVIDLAMPAGNGFDVLRYLRGVSDGARLPALIISGFSDRRTRVAGLEAGANDFIAKPVDAQELVARVRAHLRVARAASRWRRETYVDPLTGLLNRTGFGERADAEIARSRRHGTPLTVAFLDLDGFKAINDELGHGVGDGVLREFADVLARSLRGCDVAGRWGGDEFVIALPGADRADCAIVIDRIRARTESISVDRVPRRLTVSVGVATLADDVAPQSRDQVDALVAAADRAMYADKTRRRRATSRGPTFGREAS